MLFGGADGSELELRDARGKSRTIRGKFPYGRLAVLSDGGKNGRPRKEQFAPQAFAYRIDKTDEDLHLLAGHSYDRPLASRSADTFDVKDTPEAVVFTAEITPEMMEVSWVLDLLRMFAAGLIGGISPGFRIPPPSAVAASDAEKVSEEDPAQGRALIRTIFQALLYELSLVTVPAYKETQVEARSWDVTPGGVVVPDAGLRLAQKRWRA